MVTRKSTSKFYLL